MPLNCRVSNVCKDICSIGGNDFEFGILLDQGFKIKVHSGDSQGLGMTNGWVTFTWERNSRELSSQKEAKIEDLFVSAESSNWNLQFRRSLFVWELDQLANLQQRFFTIQLSRSREDEQQWAWNSNLLFSVNSAYKRGEEMKHQMNRTL